MSEVEDALNRIRSVIANADTVNTYAEKAHAQALQDVDMLKELFVAKGDAQLPLGGLNRSDEGQLEMAIGTQNGTVVIAFPRAVAWFGLDYASAKNFCELVMKRAEELKH